MKKIKVTFLGAGSTVFVKNVLGDCMISKALKGAEYALFDIDKERLEESKLMLETIKKNTNYECTIVDYTDRIEALTDADYVINAIQVGGYKPCTVTDFEIPAKYDLKQTIADTIGIGGIMRALRTMKVLKEIAEDMEKVCPNALFLNYTNPMSILTGYMNRYTNIQTVGLCHSVQACVPMLLKDLGLIFKYPRYKYKIAGINHMAWLLEVTDLNGNDLYPIIKEKAFHYLNNLDEYDKEYPDLTRYEMMRQFGYYITESSEHTAEYYPYFIKHRYPELIDHYRIPINEYIRRCKVQIRDWEKTKKEVVDNGDLTHFSSNEYAAKIIEAIESGKPFEFGGNVINNGLISNLPDNACVEIKCIADQNGINKIEVGELPPQLAALNMTHINVHELVIQAFVQNRKDYVYQAAMLDPHTSAELSLTDIRSMVDDLFEVHGDWLPNLK